MDLQILDIVIKAVCNIEPVEMRLTGSFLKTFLEPR
jgi:hypothetical protein